MNVSPITINVMDVNAVIEANSVPAITKVENDRLVFYGGKRFKKQLGTAVIDSHGFVSKNALKRILSLEVE